MNPTESELIRSVRRLLLPSSRFWNWNKKCPQLRALLFALEKGRDVLFRPTSFQSGLKLTSPAARGLPLGLALRLTLRFLLRLSLRFPFSLSLGYFSLRLLLGFALRLTLRFALRFPFGLFLALLLGLALRFPLGLFLALLFGFTLGGLLFRFPFCFLFSFFLYFPLFLSGRSFSFHYAPFRGFLASYFSLLGGLTPRSFFPRLFLGSHGYLRVGYPALSIYNNTKKSSKLSDELHAVNHE